MGQQWRRLACSGAFQWLSCPVQAFQGILAMYEENYRPNDHCHYYLRPDYFDAIPLLPCCCLHCRDFGWRWNLALKTNFETYEPFLCTTGVLEDVEECAKAAGLGKGLSEFSLAPLTFLQDSLRDRIQIQSLLYF
ncbi:hypothetical protein U9M48_002926 [Paspalum notatum var. saurae]|uniref:Uncharacterized protein n=1 Tax=Paspalum notatum var. saurae TaxID=547442 RepID=A0AAQ3PRY9_PASNO